jgi:hypothetical protein
MLLALSNVVQVPAGGLEQGDEALKGDAAGKVVARESELEAAVAWVRTNAFNMGQCLGVWRAYDSFDFRIKSLTR